jgi:hypothetical protein
LKGCTVGYEILTISVRILSSTCELFGGDANLL